MLTRPVDEELAPFDMSDSLVIENCRKRQLAKADGAAGAQVYELQKVRAQCGDEI